MILQRFYNSCVTVPLIGLLLIAFLSAACQKDPRYNRKTKTVTADTVHFPTKVQAKYAEGFRISYHKNYKLLEILKPFQDHVDTLRYSLVPRGLVDHIAIENTQEIPIPVRSLIATSTTHLGLTEMLEANEVINGVVGGSFIYEEEIQHRLKNKEITNFPVGAFNKEQALAMDPDVVMISGGQSSQFDNYRVLIDSGIGVVVNSEWLETTPLGKAEWVKVMAALLNKEQIANRKFAAVAQQYNKLKAAVDTVNSAPLVINNMPYKGSWSVSGGKSFTAQYLKDAGADYPWFDSPATGGVQKDFEVVYQMGLDADIWLHPGAAKTKADILAKDVRFKDFKAFKTGAIFNNNRRTDSSGGNDFWESGVVHPEIVLADLIRIFHPQILPEHNLYYYQKVK